MVELRDLEVFLDVCTQQDYLGVGGARPVRNLPSVRANLKRLMAYARWARVPTVSCVEHHRFDEVRGRPNPACVAGTFGQQKLNCSVLPRRVVIESDNYLCVPLDVFKQYQQAILTQLQRDPFANPKLDRLLTELPVSRFVLLGVGLETNIRLLALGLLLRHRAVTVISDASGFWNDSDAEMTVRQLAAKGCTILSTNEYLAQRVPLVRPKAGPIRLRPRHVA